MKISFCYLVTTFFTSHLSSEQGLSPNTVASYSDCMKLLVNYLCKRFSIETEAIDIQMISSDIVLDFLDSLEGERHNSPTTRNQRLAAIKSFFHFLARSVPELMHQNERIQAIKIKATSHQPPPSLTAEEVAAVLAAPDTATLLGARDNALLQLMYNSGGRVQELADLSVSDLHLDSPPSVRLTGKGRKTRVIPLWEKTVESIQHYIRGREENSISSEHLFLNIKEEPMTRFGIGRRLSKHVEAASKKCPSLCNRSITPHVIRHTTALHLVEAGNDITIVKDWLGHADVKTTILYVEISIERKRKALEKLPPPDNDAPPELPVWKQPDLMKFLNECSNKAHYVA
ncbi:MAG: tyrosine-type recombinase/integrase [Kiritimatiellae bacterium]|jgi:integrase/recombinase XerD|nr:tyrosine-type recombinase/integrase [Kiritimatiellia bacterium]